MHINLKVLGLNLETENLLYGTMAGVAAANFSCGGRGKINSRNHVHALPEQPYECARKDLHVMYTCAM